MNENILICDDNQLILKILSKFLESKNFATTSVSSARDCLKALSKHSFGTVIVDISLPDMERSQFVEQLQKMANGARIVFMSSNSDENWLRNEGLERYPFFQKPFSLSSVVKSIQSPWADPAQRVLIVDDQELLRELLADYLRRHGIEVSVAHDGKEAVKLASKQPFDSILMDVRMPNMGGIDALKALREAEIDTPVVLMSGYGDVSSPEEAQKVGAKDFLSKPFRLATATKMLDDVRSSAN